jgi:hypothetical protein
MAGTLEVALVAGGAAVAGSLATGSLQMWAVRTQWSEQRRDARSQGRRDFYLRYLTFLLNLPNEIELGVTEADGTERSRQIGRSLVEFRAQAMLFASQAVRECIQEVPDAYAIFVKRQSKLAEADFAQPRELRSGVFATTQQAFHEEVGPVLIALGDLMRDDLD